jgi:hypothetical protein
MTVAELLAVVRTIVQPIIILKTMGGAISLATSYIPGFREKYAALTPVQKSFGQGAFITIVTLLVGVFSWTHILPIVPDDITGIALLAVSWYGAMDTNQTIYNMSTQVPSVLLIKEAARKQGIVEAKVEVSSEGS